MKPEQARCIAMTLEDSAALVEHKADSHTDVAMARLAMLQAARLLRDDADANDLTTRTEGTRILK